VEGVDFAGNFGSVSMDCEGRLGWLDVRSGTGDRRMVLDGGERKNRRKIMVAAIAISRMIRM
jgi:hypothetical protein